MQHYLPIMAMLLLGSVGLADEPYGIRAKYASTAELATTNLACGELVANEEDWSDLRMGDGETPGGRRVGETLLDRNMLDSWGGASAEDVRALVALSVADQRAGIFENAGNIHSNSAGLSWITNALGQRISDFEEVRIKYAPGAATTNIWYVPTNGPTRNLTIYLDSYYSSTNAPLTVRIPAGWHPNRPVKIKLLTSRASTAARINYGLGALAGWTYAPSQQQRVITFAWVPEAEAWTEYRVQTIASQGLHTGTSVTADTTASKLALMPATIEEWVAWRNQQTW